MKKTEKNNITEGSRWLMLLVTHGCCLRCKYCFVQQDAQKYMSRKTLFKSVDFLMSSSLKHLQLQFFGGEPLMLPFKLIKETINYANKKADEKGKSLDVIVTTNGVLLNKEQVKFFRKNKVIIEISLDGTEAAQNINRPQRPGSPNSYPLIVKNLPLIFKEGAYCKASMVVTPYTVDTLVDNFKHLVSLGFKKIFIMTACGLFWSESKLSLLEKRLRELEPICFELMKQKKIYLANLREWLRPLRMNTEISVDFDGNIYSACISYLIHDEKTKKKFILGNIDKVKQSIDRFEKKRLTNSQAMQVIFRENNILDNLPNNIKAGEIMSSFVQSLTRKVVDFYKNNETVLPPRR
jgi:sulfatase maturation enzyme AslB (radical SAM superfamily)